ncbi:ceramide kinase [Salvia divinorum]|uniref:Ceramide kinase n=1 Tax=Salvia divinorum TaxID=28513 RepID=A0ABD1FQ64_SALDI
MERNQDGFMGVNSPPNPDFANGDEPSVSCCNFLLDRTGEVVITHTSDGLSWRLVDSLNDEGDNFSCLGFKLVSNTEMEVNIADVYAVNFIGWGLVHESALASLEVSLLDHSSEVKHMYRFTIYVVHKSKTQSSVWTPSVYTFGHKDLEICMSWVNQINSHLHMEVKRPKNLLVLVHPRSGKGHGCKIWETVAPLFSQAKVKTKVIVTERAGHARDMLSSITNRELNLYDGVVAVGGDGFFNEILNGVLLSRHKAPYPPSPSDITSPSENECSVSNHNVNRTISEHCDHNEDGSPLLRGSENIGLESPNFGKDSESPFPNEMFRFGLIPAGSTDAIVICTTGARDAVTSALHIILGKKVHLDIAQVVRWKKTNSANEEEEPCVRYAASFAGYGFYGDVITESEKYRWMGPKRYDYAGTKVFLQHKSYEAEVSYLEVEPKEASSSPEADPEVHSRSLAQDFKGMKWSCSKGRYLSVGASVISCRNEKAPDGLVADAHLSDGFLHLILIKECPHPYYLWHLIQLARKGGEPLGYKFVEHHKTPAFTFKSLGKEGVWNVDGELFLAQQLSVQVFRGLVSLFATGPQE